MVTTRLLPHKRFYGAVELPLGAAILSFHTEFRANAVEKMRLYLGV